MSEKEIVHIISPHTETDPAKQQEAQIQQQKQSEKE